MIILGVDPGERNYGYSIVERGGRLAIHEVGQIEDTIRNLTAKPQKPPKSRRKKEGMIPPLAASMHTYVKVLHGIFDQYQIREVHSERFQTRGVKSKSVETVSFMNGILAHVCALRRINFYSIIASTWKNHINKYLVLEDLYAFGKELGYSPHEIDSACIGLTRGGLLPPPPVNKLQRWFQLIAEQQYAEQNAEPIQYKVG